MLGRGFFREAILLCVCCFLPAVEGLAWEFNLRTSSVFEYLYFSQNIKNGFFGRPNTDNGAATGGDFASTNGWLGLEVNNLVSGSTAAKSFFTTYLYPEIRVNPAIKYHGQYRIGNSDTGANPGLTTVFANVEALWWAINLETPMGRFDYGKRPFDFGCGLQNDGDNRSEEHLSLNAYYGPFNFWLAVYPWRRTELVEDNSTRQAYWNTNDTSGAPIADFFAYLKYTSGPLEAGVGGSYLSYHFGAEGFVLQADRANIPGVDVHSNEGWAYIKYSNGRFFFNAEADCYYRRATYQRTLSGAILDTQGNTEFDNTDGSGSIFRPQYTEWQRFMAEAGVVSGPCRLSFLYAYIPGPDRRHGVLIDRQPVFVDLFSPNVDQVIFHPQHSNSTLFRHYSIILGPAYGSGLLAQRPGITSSSPLGYMVDASILAARLDYSVASNLNVYGSFLYANRASKSGFGWGSIGPLVTATTPVTFQLIVQSQRNFTSPFPSIPDNSLGWEADAGLDWNILENWTLSFAAGYRRPADGSSSRALTGPCRVGMRRGRPISGAPIPIGPLIRS
jgi:hypothetical protein